MSDAQIQQYMRQASQVGYTTNQIDQLAKAQGMPAAEVQKLKQRIADIERRGKQSDPSNISSNSRRLSRNSMSLDSLRIQDSLYNELHKDSLLQANKPKIFGSELFRNSRITFEPDMRMATPQNYVIGPDDQLIIDITGDNIANYTLDVNTNGSINIEYAGLVQVAGLSVQAATAKIKSRLQSVYGGISSGRTLVDVNIGNIRSIQVLLTGAVNRPGTYTLPSLASVYHALYASGGPAENGTYRTIQVIRNNQVVSTVDVYDFLVNGIQRGNIRLQDQDVIHIPVYVNRVELAGAVKRPGIFETLSEEHLDQLISYAGGFDAKAYTARVQIVGTTSKERRIKDVYDNAFSTYSPKNGDYVIVGELLDRFENRVEVVGAVFQPGFYGLDPGMTLVDLINQAQGLKEDAYMDRGLITRLKADNNLEVIHFNVRDVLNGNGDITLKREDQITISSIFDLRDEYRLTIQGEVREPGDFTFAEAMTAADLVQLAGGFTEAGANSRIEVSRRIKREGGGIDSTTSEVFVVDVRDGQVVADANVVLSPFDIVTVLGDAGFRTQRQVKIDGEVMYPGIYTVTREDEKISDIIARAGGLTPYAYVDGASLRRTGKSLATAKEEKANEERRRNDELSDDTTFSGFANGTSRADQNLNELAGSYSQNNAEIKEASDLVGINLQKILDDAHSRQNLLVLDGDVITVPKELQTVQVSGEVLNPNNVVYRPGKSLGYYISQAGGFTKEALKKKTFVQHANGSVEGTNMFYPEVKPGSSIIVPKRPPRERISAQGWIGMGTGVASLAAIIVSLLR
ncbi:SLBB domain-containing protein [Sphingobacterium corticibacter]|nr:SLBB domain-containing protein [Sphingobacterium corticibacter]